MTPRHLLLMLLLTLSGENHSQSPRLRLEPFGPPLPSESELRATIGTDADSIIPGVLAGALAMRGPQDVTVIAEQLPPEWLPMVSNVRFTRISLENAQHGWTEGCLRVAWVTATITGDSLTVSMVRGNRCRTSNTPNVFERTAQGWRRRDDIGGGGGGVSSECSCPVVFE